METENWNIPHSIPGHPIQLMQQLLPECNGCMLPAETQEGCQFRHLAYTNQWQTRALSLSLCKHWAHWVHLSWAYDQISLRGDFLESWELHFSLFIKKLKPFFSLIHFILTCVTLIISCMTLLVSIPAWCHSTDDSTIGMCCWTLSSLMSFYIYCRALWIPFTANVNDNVTQDSKCIIHFDGILNLPHNSPSRLWRERDEIHGHNSLLVVREETDRSNEKKIWSQKTVLYSCNHFEDFEWHQGEIGEGQVNTFAMSKLKY